MISVGILEKNKPMVIVTPTLNGASEQSLIIP